MEEIEKLKRLVELRKQGALTEDEFDKAKTLMINPKATESNDVDNNHSNAKESQQDDIQQNSELNDKYSRNYWTDLVDKIADSGNVSYKDKSLKFGYLAFITFVVFITIATLASQYRNSGISSENKPENTKLNKAQCAFQQVAGGSLIDHKGCRVSSRKNSNGHTVFDVVEENGYKRSVVLWPDSSAEVFASGKRYTGDWIDQGDQALVSINGGIFTFRYPIKK